MRGLEFFASEENLHLLSVRELNRIAAEAGLENIRVWSVGLAGWPANLLLSAQRAK